MSVAVFSVLGVLSPWDARDSGWGSWFVPAAAIFGLAGGITAGAPAVASMLKGERSKLVFLPIVLAIVCTLVLVGEAFLWE